MCEDQVLCAHCDQEEPGSCADTDDWEPESGHRTQGAVSFLNTQCSRKLTITH